MPTALLSVSDKTDLPAFARGLRRVGYDLFATGSTLKAVQDAAVDVRPVSDLTNFPEMMDGRIKTLHPGVHAGILARRDKPEHLESLASHGLRPIDLVCVNLYPFVATVTRPDVSFEEAVEQIDIGGPAMIRAAAKNHESVVVVVRPGRYSDVLGALNESTLDLTMRRRLAAEAFAHTAAYDAWIAAYMRTDATRTAFRPSSRWPGRLPSRSSTARTSTSEPPSIGSGQIREASAGQPRCRARSSASTTSRTPQPRSSSSTTTSAPRWRSSST